MLHLLTTENLIALLTLSLMEIVLGIDNIVFISILVGRLPEDRRAKIRTVGLLLALVLRVALLFAITWIMGLTKPLFHVMDTEFTGKSLILLAGGLFLIWKATKEIHHKIEGGSATDPNPSNMKPTISIPGMIVQILLLDLVFSLDSVITAVGMAKHIEIMIIAVLISVGTMIAVAGSIGRFIERHPSIKVLALAFLILIGVVLISESVEKPIGKGYVYFAMAFSLAVEMVNMRAGTRAKPIANTPL